MYFFDLNTFGVPFYADHLTMSSEQLHIMAGIIYPLLLEVPRIISHLDANKRDYNPGYIVKLESLLGLLRRPIGDLIHKKRRP